MNKTFTPFARAGMAALAIAFAAPVFAADHCDSNSSSGYKYNRAMNGGGMAGGSTVPRGWNCAQADAPAASAGYKYDQAMNAGGAAGGSTVPRGWTGDAVPAANRPVPVQP